jgi:hypothetical protein
LGRNIKQQPAQLPGQESAVMAADLIAESPSNRVTGAVDAVGPFRRPSKTRHAFLSREIGLRLFILMLAGALIVLMAREWDWLLPTALGQRLLARRSKWILLKQKMEFARAAGRRALETHSLSTGRN